MQRVIGIDFGTSTTYMNVKRYNGNKPLEDAFSYMPVMFNYGESSGYVSTIVRENADGSFDFGEKASEQMDGATIYTEIKMQLENPDEAKRLQARRIVKAFFKFLYDTYAQQAANLGSADDTEETVVSYPVKWQKETADFMLEAAKEAGFRNVRGMDEATAAVSTVLCHNAGKNLIHADKPGYLMLVDMGAGTTDLVVCKYEADIQGKLKINLINNWPRDTSEPCFGGREIDRILEGYVGEYLAKALNPALAPSAQVIAATPGQAKLWKERNVSVNLSENKPVTTCAYISTYKSMGMLSGNFPEFDRTRFQDFAKEGLADYVKLLEGCLTDAGQLDPEFVKEGLDLVILTGGHSSWYFARKIVDGTMEGYTNHPALARVRQHKDHVINLSNPQTTVSLGLVYSKLPFNLTRLAPVAKAEPPKAEQSQPPKSEKTRQTPPAAEPVKEAPETKKEMDPDDKLLKVVQRIVNTAPDLRNTNKVRLKNAVTQLRGGFPLGNNETILYAHPANEGTGLLMTDKGIYQRRKEDSNRTLSAFMTWKEFACSARTGRARTEEYTSQGASLKGDHDGVVGGLYKLYHALQLELGLVQSEPGVRHWDDRLLDVVRKFVAEDSVINGRNHVNLFTATSLFPKVELHTVRNDDLYYACDNYEDSFWGRNKEFIASCGFGVRYHQSFSGYSGDVVTWEEFVNADLNNLAGKVADVIYRHLKMGDSFVKLQKLLRAELEKLD